MSNCTILGGGTWGVALACVLAGNGHNVTIWSALESEIEMLSKNHEHKSLPGVKLPDSFKYTMDVEVAVSNSDLIVFAVASSFVRTTSAKLAPFIKEGQIIVDVAKGIEEGTLLTLSQIIKSNIPQCKIAVLSGPTHAEEVSRGIPTTIVAGSEDEEVAKFIQDLFMNEVFRVYTSTDVLGIEIGAALKNVVALSAGIADGLGYGDNSKAAIITRGIAEISRLGIAMGAKAETFYGLTGIGDLIVTCASMHSRNRRAGILMGQGMKYADAMKEVGQVVEGVYSAKAAKELAQKYNIDMPIIEQTNMILFNDKDAATAVRELMCRDKKAEV